MKFSNVINPVVSSVLNSNNLLSKETISLSSELERLLMYSATQQTWARHCSAWKLYKNFCSALNISNELPIKIENVRAFATWAISKKGLKSSTIRAYISSLNVAHIVSNNPFENFNSDKCIKMALKGAANIENLSGACKIDRLPMTYDLLAILGHRLAELNWGEFSKQLFWTACVISFFTSCRMGELLPLYEKGYDPNTTLLWQNVKMLDKNEIILFVPYCKTKGFKGKIVDMYPLKNDAKCPVAALVRLKRLAEKNGVWDPLKPVFSLLSGKNFTKNCLNRGLSCLLEDFCDENHKITGHSFRAAIPSLISSHPDRHSVSELKDWGNWESESFKAYEKNDREKRRKLFSKVVDCMFTSNYCSK